MPIPLFFLLLVVLIGLAIAGAALSALRRSPTTPNAEPLLNAWSRLDALEARISELEASVIERCGRSSLAEEPAPSAATKE